MGYLEEQVARLAAYYPEMTRKPDFDDFWKRTRQEADAVALRPERMAVPFPGALATVYDISYNGFDETRIHGWFMVPRRRRENETVPCLIHYHGFTCDRGHPAEFLQWLSLGIAVLSVDCRDQGGVTGDQATYSSGHAINVACKGILDKEEYYFRAVYMDCVKAIDFAAAQTEVDPYRIVIEGGSQGGALGMAVCALDGRPWLAMLDVPSNSNLERRVIGAHGSFSSVTEYLRLHPSHLEKAFETLSYFDTMNMSEAITCPVLASVGLKDNTCPAECYYASWNRMRGEKEIRHYPFNGHEGGGAEHNEAKLWWLWNHLRQVGFQPPNSWER